MIERERIVILREKPIPFFHMIPFYDYDSGYFLIFKESTNDLEVYFKVNASGISIIRHNGFVTIEEQHSIIERLYHD